MFRLEDSSAPIQSEKVQALPAAAQPNPYYLHLPLLVSTKQPVMLAGEPLPLLQHVAGSMRFHVNVVMPDNSVCQMEASTLIAERAPEHVSIPVALCCSVGDGQKIGDINQFAKGLIETINEAIVQYGCTLSHLMPQITSANTQPLPDPL